MNFLPCNLSALSITDILFDNCFLFKPVPIPVILSTFPSKRAQAIAEADVVLEIPISPKTNKSQLEGTESNPVCIAEITSLFSIALFSDKSFVGFSKSIGTTDNLMSAKLHS